MVVNQLGGQSAGGHSDFFALYTDPGTKRKRRESKEERERERANEYEKGKTEKERMRRKEISRKRK